MALPRLLPTELDRHVRTARELVRARRDEPEQGRLETASPLDRLLRGGLRRGELLEVVGWGSSGRFSLVVSALAAITGRGEAAALVDLGDALDPQGARAAGVELERLLWARPRHMKEALASAEAILDAGLPCLVVDLGVPPVRGGRGAEAFWLRLARAAQKQRTALLVSSPYRVTGTAAGAVIEARDRRAVWHGRGFGPRILGGVASRLDLVKGPGWQEARREDLTLGLEGPIGASTVDTPAVDTPAADTLRASPAPAPPGVGVSPPR
ncbi:MAG: hypothetical protein AAGN66_12170, partial [Acidobacteriota bacterium]